MLKLRSLVYLSFSQRFLQTELVVLLEHRFPSLSDFLNYFILRADLLIPSAQAFSSESLDSRLLAATV